LRKEKPKAALDLDTPERPGNEKHFSFSHALASHIVQYFSNLIPPYGRIDNALFVKQWFSPVFPLSISAGNIFRAASGMRAVCGVSLIFRFPSFPRAIATDKNGAKTISWNFVAVYFSNFALI